MADTVYRNNTPEIERIFNELKAAIATEEAQLAALDNAPLGEVIDAAGYCRDFHQELDAIKSSLGAIVNKYNSTVIPKRIMDMVVHEGLKFEKAKTQHAEEYRATIGERTYVSMGDPEAGIEWLKEHGHSDFVKETTNAQSLGKLAEELGKVNEDLPEELFKVTKSFATTLVRTKPKM